MLFKTVVMLFFATSALFADHVDPATVIPTITSETYQVDGLFGKNPRYSENAVEMINYINHLIDGVEYKKIDSDIFAYGVSSMTCQEGFEMLAPTVKSTNLTGLDAANWANESPATIYEAIDRIAALIKTLNANTAIP